jgi:hypothetical protein
VDHVAPTADAASSTATLTVKSGRVPDIATLRTHLEETMRVGAHLGGVELTVIGTIQKQGETLYLVSRKTGERLRLLPLTEKVQWDAKKSQPAAISQAEREAFGSLETQLSKTLTLTGPLRADNALEVRLVRPLFSPTLLPTRKETR